MDWSYYHFHYESGGASEAAKDASEGRTLATSSTTGASDKVIFLIEWPWLLSDQKFLDQKNGPVRTYLPYEFQMSHFQSHIFLIFKVHPLFFLGPEFPWLMNHSINWGSHRMEIPLKTHQLK